MQYTTLGRIGLKVSRLCLGTMNFGPQADERLLGNIAGNTYEHDSEHRGWIEERLKGA